MIRSGQAVTMRVPVYAATGGNVDADALPTGAIYVDGVLDAGSVTVTDDGTGDYKLAWTVPTTTHGQCVQVSLSCAVGGVSIKSYVFLDFVESDIATILARIGTPVALDSGAATLAANLVKLADDSGGSAYDATTDSMHTKTGGLTAQEVRDAMKMAPTGGAADAGSVDAHLDDILADTNELQTDWHDGGRLDTIADNILDDTGTSGVALSTSLLNKIADHVLRRRTSNVEASSDGDTLHFRSLYGAVATAVHRLRSSEGTITAYRSDDATALGAGVETTDADAEPIVEVDWS